jgi:hypothetical protein
MNYNNKFFLIILAFVFAMHDSFSAQLTKDEEKKNKKSEDDKIKNEEYQ